MDATVQLALMAKANQIFPTAEQFLSFPALSPLTYRPEQLRFATGRLEKQDWLDFSEFSRVVNHIPRGPLYDLADDSYLWDVYGGILDSAELPGQPPTATEEAEYQRAIAYLYVTSPEGLRTPSEAARKYGWYRDAVLVAEQDYAGKQISAQYAEPDAKQRWEELDGPMLRRQLEQLKADWDSKGFRKEVEAARVIERRQAALQYSVTWSRWREQYNPDLDKPTDILLNRFAGTSFSPADIAQRDDWRTITLEGSEIEALSAAADPELRRVLSADSQRSDIARVSFDARSVGLDRPWFAKDLLTSRCWRLPDGQTVVSDGADLSQGSCPAYVAGLVFARNVQVTRTVAGQAEPVKVRCSPQYLFNLASAPQMMVATPMPVTPAPDVAPRPVVRDHRNPAVRDHRKPAMRAAANPTMRMATTVRAAEFSVARPRTMDVRVAMPTAVLTAQPTPPAPTPTPPIPDADDESITILALICRRVPRSPNPDPALPWTS